MSDLSLIDPIRMAILGSTSHIAKNLIIHFGQAKEYHLILFARTIEKVRSFLEEMQLDQSKIEVYPYEEFLQGQYDVIINCVGVTQGNVLIQEPNVVFKITEMYDNYVLQYLQGHPHCTYIHISSGAVYGGEFEKAAGYLTKAEINVNQLQNSDFYGISKLYMEAKHRSLNDLNIVDLRVFNFFSRFIDLNARYLLCDIINCLKADQPLNTSIEDMVRDFLHPSDLINMIELCIKKRKINAVYDLYSKQAISKSEILQFFQDEYNLRYETQLQSGVPIAGLKRNYFTNNHSAVDIGYIPAFSSLDCIRDETAVLIK